MMGTRRGFTRLITVAAAIALGVCLAVPRIARAHELRPALLSLVQVSSDTFAVELHVPVEISLAEMPHPIFPEHTEILGSKRTAHVGPTFVERSQIRVPGGLAGATLGMRWGRSSISSELLVRVSDMGGRVQTGRIIPSTPLSDGSLRGTWIIPAHPRRWSIAGTYLRLGIEHILTGIDHLAFVLGLMLINPAFRQLWRSITAFTAAHSITLGMSAVGVAQVPPAPVEAVIALSILFVAREVWLVARGRPSPSARSPWRMAFVFGLLHGLGFAGVLAAVGLPSSDVPLALFTFNLGVETGQLFFIAAVALVGKVAGGVAILQRPIVKPLPGYILGTLAAFWCCERVARFWD